MMLKKRLILATLASVLATTYVHAGSIFGRSDSIYGNDWRVNRSISNTYDMMSNGKVVARWLGIPQYPQPTNYSCGSTVTAMQMTWETHKKGRALKYRPLSIHNYINTAGGATSGLTTVELKSGQAKLVSYINRTTNLGINVKMAERKYGDTKSAIKRISQEMFRNYSPAILYGNVKYASAGGHYLLATGAVYCPKGKCTFGSHDIIGLFINDSAYNSPAYSSSHPVRKLAISTRKYMSHKELESYWKKTGSRLPWARGHMFMFNTSRKV